MKIKVEEPQGSHVEETEWRKCISEFSAYMDRCKEHSIRHDMLLQATADCLAHLLVRHTRNTQAIISVMGATIARHEGMRREMVKKK